MQRAAVQTSPKPLSRQDIRAIVATDRIEILDGLKATLVAAGEIERERLRWIAAADRAELWRVEGCRSTTQLVSGIFQISNWKAKRMIDSSHALETLPRTSAALESGRLSMDKVLELTRFATAFDEEGLIRWAQSTSASVVRHKADLAAKAKEPEEDKVESDRNLQWWFDQDCLRMEASGPIAEGKAFIDAIDALAKTLPVHPDITDADTALDQRRWDALFMLVTSSGDRLSETKVVLHAPLSALTDGEGAGSFAGDGIVSAETVRRLCCEGPVEIVLLGKKGNTAGIGRVAKDPPRWLRRAVLKRDSHRCAFPGCEMARFLKVHHIEFWVRGGPTNISNLVTVCHFHHKLVHHYGWSVTLGSDERAIWFRPGGRRFEPGIITASPDRAPPRQKRRLRLAEGIGYSRLFGLAAVL